MSGTRARKNIIAIQGSQGSQGPQGANGTQGPQGDDGGLFAFEIVNGDLIVYYEDGTDPPPFSINQNGELIYTF